MTPDPADCDVFNSAESWRENVEWLRAAWGSLVARGSCHKRHVLVVKVNSPLLAVICRASLTDGQEHGTEITRRFEYDGSLLTLPIHC